MPTDNQNQEDVRLADLDARVDAAKKALATRPDHREVPLIQAASASQVKPFYKSKTLWFNAFCIGAIALESQLNILQPYLRPDVYAVFAVILGVGNKVLRVFTVMGVKL